SVFCPFALALLGVKFDNPVGNVVGSIGGAGLAYFLSGDSLAARWSLGAALVVGFVSFLAGFIGPMIVTPDANQGPLLGIFFTGPLGFIVGAVAGMLFGFLKESQRDKSEFSPTR
ncbi:MAG TPA: hypothetical protein VGH32_14480, partial [Pirellulales bacterium]